MQRFQCKEGETGRILFFYVWLFISDQGVVYVLRRVYQLRKDAP